MKHRVLSLVADAALVVLFVFIGTRNHDTDKDIAGVLSTAAPFLVGLACGWWASRGWKNPTAVQTGIVVWIATVVIGMLLRNFAWNRGTAGAFIVVATIFNAFTLVGWRVARENFGSRRKS
jgi:FtsH-binding integral membrane protein